MMIPKVEDITPKSFKEAFHKILEFKESVGMTSVIDDLDVLRERASAYAIRYKNGALGWASNIWSRSASNTVVIEDDSELKHEHKLLLLRVLEHVLAQGPFLKVDGCLGEPATKVAMHARAYVDPQFPDIAYRWSQLVFRARKDGEPDVEILIVPHYLRNPRIPGADRMLMVMRFPKHGLSVVTASSYQGELKKAALSHWMYHVYQRGCTGEHAALREFTVKTVDGEERRIVMAIWGATGSGKSTHGMYVWSERVIAKYVEQFGVNPLDYVKGQVIKNDDVIAIDEDRVYGSERGCWVKTEDLTPELEAIYNAAMSPRALHENTEFDESGNPSFEGELFQYFGMKNRNARSVIYLEDTGYFDGSINSNGPLTTAVFLSPGYFTDYAWVKLEDVAFAARALAEGKTVGHQAQSPELVGRVRFIPRYSEFTIGVPDAAHVIRFYEYLKKRAASGKKVEVYQLNTTGRIVARYKWVEEKLGDKTLRIPVPEVAEVDGRRKVVGGTAPTIEETEFFLLQASRGAVEWEPHPIWGEKVLVPKRVEGMSQERLKELSPTTHLTSGEFKDLLRAETELSNYLLEINNRGKLPEEIKHAKDEIFKL